MTGPTSGGPDSTSGPNPFWDFSLALYAAPGVAEACLALQDRHGADVNLLLFCCWAGARGHALEETELDRLMAAAAPWQERVVAPLRAARRWLKAEGLHRSEAGPLYAGIKAQELAAERQEQDRLQALLPLPAGAPSEAALAGNLERYLARLGAPDGAPDSALAAALRAAVAGPGGDDLFRSGNVA